MIETQFTLYKILIDEIKNMKIKILMIASICLSTTAFAGGYRVATQGQNALGMGHTGVAMTDSAEVVFFNPAGMSLLETDTNISAGTTLISGITKYQNTAANVSAETNNPIGTPFNLYFAKKLNHNMSYGFGVYTPYGNTVEWEKDWAGSHLVNNIKLQTIYVQPTISYQFNDQFSIGIGPTYTIGSIEFNRNLTTALVDANGDRANVTVEASNITAWGYNIGFLAKPMKQFSIGLSYRSRVDMQARGEKADFENIPASQQAAFPDTTFDADLVLPAELTLGISINLGASTVVALDVNRTYWSAYKSLDLAFNNSAGTSVNPRNYNDVNIYRIGIQQKIGNTLTLRGGAYYDDSPISPGYYTPETPRNDSIGLTAGASYAVTKNIAIDLSFLYLMFDEFNGSYNFYDQSGTTISFAGDYKSSVIAGGFGLNYKY